MKKFFTGFALLILLLPSLLFGWSPVPDDVWNGEADLQYQYQLPDQDPVVVPKQKYVAGLYYGTNNYNTARQLHKPIILLGRYKFGFDKHFGSREFYEAINNSDNINGYKFLDNLRNQKFDLIIVDMDLSVEIQGNAFALINLLESVKSKTQDQITVIGLEIGGLISRYALTYMEKNNMNHRVGLHVTSDTPHQGLNIPYGLQWYTWAVSQDFANKPYELGLMSENGFSLNPLKSVFTDFENYKSLKQMMIVDYASTEKYNKYLSNGQKSMVCHPLREKFLMELVNLGDYPKNVKNIAVSSGVQSIVGQVGSPIFYHNYDHWGEFDWWFKWDGFHYIADPLRLRMSSYVSPLNSNTFERTIYKSNIYNSSSSSSYKPDGIHTEYQTYYSNAGIVKSSDGQYYHVGKEVSESKHEYGNAHLKIPQTTYPYSVHRWTRIKIVKFSRGNCIPVFTQDYTLTGICNDTSAAMQGQIAGYKAREREQNAAINNVLTDLGCSWSNFPGSITNFEEPVGTGKFVYTRIANSVMCQAVGDIPNTNCLVASFNFHHQQPKLHDDEVRWDRIPKIDYDNSLYINADDYSVPLPTYEYANGSCFTYKNMLIDFLKLGKFWGSIVTIPRQCVGSILGYDIYLSQVDVNIFNEGTSESSMDFYQDKLCYIPTTSALDIRQNGSCYTADNCRTQYTLADKINAVTSANVKSPYDIVYNNSNNYDSYHATLKGNVVADVAAIILPHNLILSKTTVNSDNNLKARNNIYMGNDYMIKAGVVTREAGNEIILEPGTTIEPSSNYLDVKMEINPQLKNGGK